MNDPYGEWLRERRLAQSEHLARGVDTSRVVATQNADRDAEEAIRAVEVAEEHVAARYGGMPDIETHVLTLFVAANILWRQQRPL